MATLIIQNNLSIPRSYLNGVVTIAANTAYTVTALQIYPISRDPVLVSDCQNSNVFLSDSTNIYNDPTSMLNYLNQIALSLGGAVVGYIGNTAPNYQITIGGKDSNNNSQPARMNQFADLSTNFRNTYRNITGNATTTVKSGSGTLHGILINDNSTGGTVKIYDNTAGSGTVVATIQVGTPSGGLLSNSGIPGSSFIGPLGLEFSTGLTIVTTGSSNNDVTALYQ